MLRSHRLIARLLSGLLGAALLSSCGPVVSYADVRQTAQALGCWPNRPAYPTPPPVTVTPPVPLTPVPLGWRRPVGQPTPTAFPTTTPYPRCAAAPGETLVPWPTPVPPPPPFPTMEDTRAGGGSGQKTTLQLPEVILSTDITTHPTQGWPAVAATVWSGNDNPERAFVSVYNPRTRTWTPAHQVDIGAASIGRFARSIEVAITGDGVVHAVWGMSQGTPGSVWAAESRDYGTSWSVPVKIGDRCRQVNDLAATLSGWLVAGLICDVSPTAVQPAIATRSPAGVWSLTRLPGAVWYFSAGAVAIANDRIGETPQATVLFLTGPDGAMIVPPRLLLFRAALAEAAPSWTGARRDFVLPGGLEAGPRTWHARSVVYRPQGAAQDHVSFMFSDAERYRAYAVTSQDGGASWLTPELVAAPEAGGEQIHFAAPAFDSQSQRLVAIWTCCTDGSWNDTLPSTHYVSASVPGSGVWQGATAGLRVPLITGARAAGATVTAQGRNAAQTWLAWIEGGRTLEVRSIDLATVLPRQEAP